MRGDQNLIREDQKGVREDKNGMREEHGWNERWPEKK